MNADCDLSRLKPETILVSANAYDKLMEMLNKPPKPNEKLKALFKKRSVLESNEPPQA